MQNQVSTSTYKKKHTHSNTINYRKVTINRYEIIQYLAALKLLLYRY